MAERRPGRSSRKGVQVAIAALLVLIVVALVGGIIWYNFRKSETLAIDTAERLMAESSDDTVRRIDLFYEPVLAIVALASRVPLISEMTPRESGDRVALVLTGLRRYPQLFSLYAGYDNGDFDMMTRVSGTSRSDARKAIGAPDDAFFAHETIRAESDGVRRARWVFLDESGAPIGERAVDGTTFDPRLRQWYRLARDDDKVHRSDPYIFASSQEIGITLSRKLDGDSKGVFGADLAVREVSSFLAEKKISASSEVFLFNSRGEIIAYPDDSKIQRAIRNQQESTLVPTPIASLGNPAVAALYESVQKQGGERMRRLDVDGRGYLAQAVPIMRQLGEVEYLGMVVPVDEITAPVDRIRTDTLVYSLAVLLLVLPIYITLVFIWLDRQTGQSSFSLADLRNIDTKDLD
ncbi:MAG TPA: cache domain-containing protein [Stellaceae bacterium]|nr:cache domain-containing protein [Stellaceae bacterium]